MDNKAFRIMGLDYGDVRIGISLSDVTHFIASGHSTYTRKTNRKDLDYLKKLIDENGVKLVVFGLPLNMDGSEGLRVTKTRSFAEKLKAYAGVEVDFFDERLSSVEAEDILLGAGLTREKRKEKIDMIASTLILQGYLDFKRENKNE